MVGLAAHGKLCRETEPATRGDATQRRPRNHVRTGNELDLGQRAQHRFGLVVDDVDGDIALRADERDRFVHVVGGCCVVRGEVGVLGHVFRAVRGKRVVHVRTTTGSRERDVRRERGRREQRDAETT